MLTQEYCNRVAREVESVNLGMEVLLEQVSDAPDKSDIGRCIRMYITSKELGGTLAVNCGDGWIPIYPAYPNYPLKGSWYSPSRTRRYIPRESWHDAVIDAFQPERIIERLEDMGRRLTVERAAKLRHPFRAAVAVAVLKNLGNQPVPS